MSSDENKREITGIILFFSAIVLVLMYYLPASVTGVAGSFMRSLGYGLIGSAAFMIPVFLIYAGIDFFTEKRAGVSPIRVRSVIITIICVSALFAVSTMDFDWFRLLCSDELGEKTKATKAISLLWKSGPDSSVITNPASDSSVMPGGLIGGGIALALYRMFGKAITILTLIVFLLTQLIVVFHISLKKTARKTAVALSSRVKRGNHHQATRPEYVDRRNIPGTNSPRSPFVNSPTNSYNISLYDVNYDSRNGGRTATPQVSDPFNRRIPVDRKTGFIDVSSNEFGVTGESDPDHLTYVDRTVDTTGSVNAPDADFTYTPMPKNPRLKPAKQSQYGTPSFLKKDAPADFMDLSGAVYPGDYPVPADDGSLDEPAHDTAYDSDYAYSYENDDLPYEIQDEPYSYSSGQRKIRKPNIGGVPSAPSAVSAPEAASQEIPVNKGIADTSVSESGGREVVTNTASNTTVFNDPAPARERRKEIGRYIPPPLRILADPVKTADQRKEEKSLLQKRAHELEETLESFGIRNPQVVNITHGPAITRFELTIEKGIKVSRVVSLQDDIAMAMAAVSVRIEAPIPGKSAIGIEIPNSKVSAVHLKGLLQEKEFKTAKPLEVPLGRDIPNRPIMCDLAKMPHLLIAGSTGSGKSVCINTILTSILYHSSPDQVRMILIDPKVVELSVYNGIPHLYMPVVTDPKKAANALKWAVMEMERRYKLFAENSVRDLEGYNDYLIFQGEKPLPLVLIVIDELADLMTVASKDVETQIARLAAMARAAGLHMIIATQRPSVDVITGVIKSNVPSRIAFAVSSGVDSRTILDSVGAEKLLGKGDMLYAPLSATKPIRGQGAFVSDKEVAEVTKDLKSRYGDLYDENIIKTVNTGLGEQSAQADQGAGDGGSGEDELLDQAVNTVIEAGNASVSILQRRLGVGYPRAARLIDVLEQKHVIGPFEGSKPRKVLITKTDWLEMKAKGGV